MFDDWLKLLSKLSKNKYSTEDFVCPECGQKGVKYVHVGDSATRIGYLPVWCENCNRGIQISRVEIPEEAVMIEFGGMPKLPMTFSLLMYLLKNAWNGLIPKTRNC